MRNTFLNKFQRITTSGEFIPEIDGLRFIAISSVIVYHLNTFLVEKNLDNHKETGVDHSTWNALLFRGHYGVVLFFIISGFILGMPFARHYLSGAKLPSLKSYFLRRIIRLEPPYILIMTSFFLAYVFVVHRYTLEQLWPSLLASLTYTHNFFYGRNVNPLVNAVAWSLEVEIQFYVLVPLIATIFKIRDQHWRRMIMVLIMLFFIVFQCFYTPPFLSLYEFVQYFLVGFLLVDLYINRPSFKMAEPVEVVTGIVSFAAIWCYGISSEAPVYIVIGWRIISLMSMFTFFYIVLFTPTWKRIMSRQLITVIGGMCYSIYLLHYSIISIFGNFTIRYNFTNMYFVDWVIQSVMIILSVFVISAIYFRLVEQPCMEKDWYKRIIPFRQTRQEEVKLRMRA